MKCDKCGNENVTFHMRTNNNGAIIEMHLCADCAEEANVMDILGKGNMNFTNMMRFGPFGRMPAFTPMGFQGFFPVSFGMMPMTERYPFPQQNFPQFQSPTTEQIEPEESEQSIPSDAGEKFRNRRELTAMKYELNNAIRTEEFEKAAELRDKIRALESKK